MEKFLVSVVIPTWNAASFVDRVLAALVKQEGVHYEIIVVDNGVVNNETEQVCAKYQSFPALKYLRFEKQLGYAGAVNAGTVAAHSRLVAVINNDNIPDPRWLVELVMLHQKNPGCIIGSLVDRPDMPDPLGAVFNIWCRVVRPKGYRRGETLLHPDGSAFLFDKKVYGQPYDEDYFIYQEDLALGWRAWLMGKKVLLAEKSRAVTFDGGSTRRIAYRTAYYTERNRWLNYFIFLEWRSLIGLMPALKLDACLKFFFGSNRKAKLHAWLWILGHPGVIMRKRRAMQKLRKVDDAQILPHFSCTYVSDGGRGAWLLNPIFKFLSWPT